MNRFRRSFLRNLTFAASALAANAVTASKTVSWHVAGFTCITCATGLETILSRKAGVLHVEASYPQASVHIKFDAAKTSEAELRDAIAEMGFRVEPHA